MSRKASRFTASRFTSIGRTGGSGTSPARAARSTRPSGRSAAAAQTSRSRCLCLETGTRTFAPGQTTKTITIVVNGDIKKEADETFYLDLFGNSSNSLFTKKSGIGTILNDD